MNTDALNAAPINATSGRSFKQSIAATTAALLALIQTYIWAELLSAVATGVSSAIWGNLRKVMVAAALPFIGIRRGLFRDQGLVVTGATNFTSRLGKLLAATGSSLTSVSFGFVYARVLDALGVGAPTFVKYVLSGLQGAHITVAVTPSVTRSWDRLLYAPTSAVTSLTRIWVLQLLAATTAALEIIEGQLRKVAMLTSTQVIPYSVEGPYALLRYVMHVIPVDVFEAPSISRSIPRLLAAVTNAAVNFRRRLVMLLTQSRPTFVGVGVYTGQIHSAVMSAVVSSLSSVATRLIQVFPVTLAMFASSISVFGRGVALEHRVTESITPVTVRYALLSFATTRTVAVGLARTLFQPFQVMVNSIAAVLVPTFFVPLLVATTARRSVARASTVSMAAMGTGAARLMRTAWLRLLSTTQGSLELRMPWHGRLLGVTSVTFPLVGVPRAWIDLLAPTTAALFVQALQVQILILSVLQSAAVQVLTHGPVKLVTNLVPLASMRRMGMKNVTAIAPAALTGMVRQAQLVRRATSTIFGLIGVPRAWIELPALVANQLGLKRDARISTDYLRVLGTPTFSTVLKYARTLVTSSTILLKIPRAITLAISRNVSATAAVVRRVNQTLTLRRNVAAQQMTLGIGAVRKASTHVATDLITGNWAFVLRAVSSVTPALNKNLNQVLSFAGDTAARFVRLVELQHQFALLAEVTAGLDRVRHVFVSASSSASVTFGRAVGLVQSAMAQSYLACRLLVGATRSANAASALAYVLQARLSRGTTAASLGLQVLGVQLVRQTAASPRVALSRAISATLDLAVTSVLDILRQVGSTLSLGTSVLTGIRGRLGMLLAATTSIVSILGQMKGLMLGSATQAAITLPRQVGKVVQASVVNSMQVKFGYFFTLQPVLVEYIARIGVGQFRTLGADAPVLADMGRFYRLVRSAVAHVVAWIPRDYTVAIQAVVHAAARRSITAVTSLGTLLDISASGATSIGILFGKNLRSAAVVVAGTGKNISRTLRLVSSVVARLPRFLPTELVATAYVSATSKWVFLKELLATYNAVADLKTFTFKLLAYAGTTSWIYNPRTKKFYQVNNPVVAVTMLKSVPAVLLPVRVAVTAVMRKTLVFPRFTLGVLANVRLPDIVKRVGKLLVTKAISRVTFPQAGPPQPLHRFAIVTHGAASRLRRRLLLQSTYWPLSDVNRVFNVTYGKVLHDGGRSDTGHSIRRLVTHKRTFQLQWQWLPVGGFALDGGVGGKALLDLFERGGTVDFIAPMGTNGEELTIPCFIAQSEGFKRTVEWIDDTPYWHVSIQLEEL